MSATRDDQSGDESAAKAAALIRLLDVRPGDADGSFIGARKHGGVGRVFGGQVIAQAVMAASRTVAEGRPIHSLHCNFLRPASEDHEIAFAVDADLDGQSFSNRHVVARQQGKPVFRMTASFQVPETGLGHQPPMPDVPPPEALKSFADYIAENPNLASPVFKRIVARPSAFDYRPVALLTPQALAQPHTDHAHCWIKVGNGRQEAPQVQQRALLAWISDTLLLASAFRAHGIQIGMGGYQIASLDHAMWFHADVGFEDWLLYAIHSPWTGAARGLSAGRFFARDGRLLASVTQEGLMRPV